MSRIGKKPVVITKGVQIEAKNGLIKVKGPKGELTQTYRPEISIAVEGESVKLSRPNDEKQTKALHGLYRALIANMVKGVTEGFEKKLEIVGVGYKAEMKGNVLQLALGYSHPIYFVAPDGVTITAASPTNLSIKGIDKQIVGSVADKIRSFRKPEPYKGKGVKYEGEYIRRKAGKTAASK